MNDYELVNRVISDLTNTELAYFRARLMRTRKRFIPITLNERTVFIPRQQAIDFVALERAGRVLGV